MEIPRLMQALFVQKAPFDQWPDNFIQWISLYSEYKINYTQNVGQDFLTLLLTRCAWSLHIHRELLGQKSLLKSFQRLKLADSVTYLLDLNLSALWTTGVRCSLLLFWSCSLSSFFFLEETSLTRYRLDICEWLTSCWVTERRWIYASLPSLYSGAKHKSYFTG